MKTRIRLGFHYHVPALARPDGVYTPGFQGRFIDSLAEFAGDVLCFLHSPLPADEALMDYRLAAENVRLVDLGPTTSVPRRLLGWRRYTRPLRQNLHRLDALLIRGPSPLLPHLARAAGDLPLALLLVGDYLAGIDALPQPRWRKELIRLWAYINERQQKRAARRALVFVNSRLLYEEYQPLAKRLFEVRTTTLHESDFYLRSDTCAAPPYRLLYAGRMDRAKGILHMVEALSLLVSRGEDLILDLVGWQEKGDPVLSEVEQLAGARGMENRVIYHGYKPVGAELFHYYRQADLYLIASLASEGFPRTIWEAMAHSLPVIATRVGSIPHLLQGKAELIPPGDALALAEAISRLLHNPELRQKYILAGRELASQNTASLQARKIVEEIEACLTPR